MNIPTTFTYKHTSDSQAGKDSSQEEKRSSGAMFSVINFGSATTKPNQIPSSPGSNYADSDNEFDDRSIEEEERGEAAADDEWTRDRFDGAGGAGLNDDDALEETQVEIAGDFERLVTKLKTSEEAGARISGWSISIDEDDDFNLEDDLMDPTSTSRRKRGRKKGPRAGVELSHQVKALIGQGAEAYVSRDLPEAMRLCQEVIRIEPAAHPAWNTLALVHEDLHELDTALKLKIMGAHLLGDSELWRELGRASRQSNQMQQALYCFRKAVALDPRDIDAIWDRSVVLRETDKAGAALNGFLSILKIAPYHMGVLLQVGALFSELKQYHRGITLYNDALVYYQESMPDGPPSGEEADCILLLITLADFCNSVGEYERAVSTVRDGARWIQGRAKQRYWSSVTDDREYDVQGSARAQGSDDSTGRPQGFAPLDPNLRHRLALARLSLGDLEEGLMHGAIVLQNDVREYYPLFGELAAAYFDKKLYQAALGIYEELATYGETAEDDTLLKISACHRHLGDFEKAVEVMKYFIQVRPENDDAKMKLAEIYEILEEPQLALSLVNEVIARRKARGGGASAHPDPSIDGIPIVDNPSGAMFEERKSSGRVKRTIPVETIKAIEQSRQAVVDECWAKLDALDPDGPDAVQWLKEAGVLVDIFRETRELFVGNRFSQFRGSVNERRLRRLGSKDDPQIYAADMASRLQMDISYKHEQGGSLNEFRRHTFDEWLAFFMQYAFQMTRSGEYAIADEVLRHMMQSNAFVTFRDQTSLRLALLACATVQRDYSAIQEHSRRLVFSHQFNNDPLRLYLACLGGGIYTVDTFIDTNFQKLMRREIDIYKLVASGADKKWNPARNRWAVKEASQKESSAKAASANGSEDEGSEAESGKAKGGKKTQGSAIRAADPSPSSVTGESPILLALYGQLSSTSKSYQSALFYLFQAYDLQPDDPVICLSLAVASISRAMQRQADNRHHLIAQGMAFIQRYRAIRKEDYTDEVEYNFGRFFHQLGLHSLAVKHYNRALDYVERQMQVDEDEQKPNMAKEAAYNLVLIYGTTGGHGLAKDIARKWLSF